ncbi:MAG: GxxExxY protein [Planctomycetota bacterium]
MAEEYKYAEVSEKVIKAAYQVHNTLGFGFLEKVYENALAIELREVGLSAEQQQPVKVSYRGAIVGDYVADLIVDGRILVELKSVATLDKSHEVQLVNYLKATGIEVCLHQKFKSAFICVNLRLPLLVDYISGELNHDRRAC